MNQDSNMSNINPKAIRIGELLIISGIIDEVKWEGILQFSNQMRLPVGKVLCLQGHITEEQLNTGLKVQSMIKDGLISLDNGIKALQICINESIDLDTAIKRSDWVIQEVTNIKTNRLGELALESGLVSIKQLEECLVKSKEAGLPLGMIFTDMSLIDENLKKKLLTVQKLIRRNLIDRHMGVQILKSMRQENISFKECLALYGIDPDLVTDNKLLEDILIAANIINTTELSVINELILQDESSFETIIVKYDYIDQKLLDYAKHVILILEENSLEFEQATLIIKKIAKSDINLEDAIEEILNRDTNSSTSSIISDFLVKIKVLSFQKATEIFNLAVETKTSFTQCLTNLGILSEFMLAQTEFIVNLLTFSLIEFEQANIVYYYSLENQIEAFEVLKLFGWLVNE